MLVRAAELEELGIRKGPNARYRWAKARGVRTKRKQPKTTQQMVEEMCKVFPGQEPGLKELKEEVEQLEKAAKAKEEEKAFEGMVAAINE